jgi:nucleotide-binding universal stress UspA family protein
MQRCKEGLIERSEEKEDAMSKEMKREARSRIVVVVGVDLSDVSEHLLTSARDLLRSVDDAELHVVHVIHPEPLRQRLAEPLGAVGIETRAQTEYAQWEIERLRNAIVQGSGAKCVVHTPVGGAAEELTRIAREVSADIILVEAHDHSGLRRVLHRSVVSRIIRTAPCSVLTIRTRQPAARAATKPRAPAGMPRAATVQ